MATVYALFIAINQYPNQKDVLQGCIHDMHHVLAYLNSYCRLTGVELKAQILIDNQATRNNVIAGFKHFMAASADDPCVFYFAGHGARSAAPEVFWHLEPDHKCDSLVCWDSRQPGGHDLMDKELSFLIWQANQGKNLPFITITDCCHSGSLRNINDTPYRIRGLREIGEILPAEKYLGVEHYKQTAEGHLSPPLGRRVHLAASRDSEKAKEIQIDDQSRGVFSYCLVETLCQTGPFVSYAELLGRVQLRIKSRIREQSPQLNATIAGDKNLGFLTGNAVQTHPPWLVSHDRSKGWVVNVGAIHGISVGDDNSRTILELPELQKFIEITEAMPDFSCVSGMETSDQNRTYAAVLHRHATPLIDLKATPESETILAWQQVLELTNPATGISNSEITIELYRITEPGNINDDAPVEEVDWQTATAVFSFTRVNEQWSQPAFQLKIRNNSYRTLWVSLLYLGSDFSISNMLIRKQALEPGQEVWALDVYDDYPYRSIPLRINKSLQERGITAINEYLKVLISTAELNTDLFCQKGLTSDSIQRSRRQFYPPEHQEWATKTICLRINGAA